MPVLTRRKGAKMNVLTMPTVGMAGFVGEWEIVNKDGSVARACRVPQKNMILDSGLDLFYTANNQYVYTNMYSYFAIGTGTTAPSYTDTTLGAEKYRGTCTYATWKSVTYSDQGDSPYYIYFQRGVETPMGSLDSSVHGEYGEIGFSNSASTDGTLFSKFRIVDELGSPTTIYVSSTQQLRLKYILRFQLIPDVSTHYASTITGIGSMGFNALWQATSGAIQLIMQKHIWPAPAVYAFSGTPTLATIGGAFSVAGGSSSGVTMTEASYSNGNHYIDKTVLFGVNDAVFTITSFSLYPYFVGVHSWAMVLDTPIAKPNTHALTLTFRFPWARA